MQHNYIINIIICMNTQNLPPKLSILYFTSGNSLVMHSQIHFSILTVASQLDPEDCIVVMTDIPELYKFDNLPCKFEVIQIDKAMMQEWRTFIHKDKQYDFFWRIKIKAIQSMGDMHPDSHLMYLDGDTCLAGNITNIREILDQGIPLMHRNEGPLSKMHQHSLRMWNQIKGKEYAGITINDNLHEWNAGVVAIPAGKAKQLATQALAICDKMISEGVEPKFVEQYSLAITLYSFNHNMKEAKPWIIHYWHNKYFWSKFIARFFCASYSSKRELRTEINEIRKMPLFHIDKWLRFKRVIRKHILGKR